MKNKSKKETKEKQLRHKRNAIITFFIAVGTAAILYVVFGAVTAIIPNPFFTRMTQVGWLEQSSLLITSSLLGTYIGLLYYGRIASKNKVCNATAASGGIFGFLTFGCSICNKILVFFLGIAGVLTYFEPLRPLLGILSIGLLLFAVLAKARILSVTRIL
ncbi:hypothetical protein J4448_05450 [Candidatus Woesearchaeota archaeon]|nr:hypothetical protein [Candidatus Woesearchaeota archaeon]